MTAHIYYYAEAANSGQDHTVQYNTAQIEFLCNEINLCVALQSLANFVCATYVLPQI